MLNVTVVPHREFSLANEPSQKLFLQLDLTPMAEAASARANLAAVVLVDSSGSMQETVSGKKSKMALVIEALQNIVNSNQLTASDSLAIVRFADQAQVLAPLTPATDKGTLLRAIQALGTASGSTYMGAGMQRALQLLSGVGGNRQMILLTDGQTFDEPVVDSVIDQFEGLGIPVSAIGVGDDWNQDLLSQIADRTKGSIRYMVADSEEADPPAIIKVSELPGTMAKEFKRAASEVVTQVMLSVNPIKDVGVNRVTKLNPSVTDVALRSGAYSLGNVESLIPAVFILELSIPTRAPGRVRICRLGITYEVPGNGYRGELPPIDVVIEYSFDEALITRVNAGVMKWVQARNLVDLVEDATKTRNPDEARTKIMQAQNITRRIGNAAMEKVLEGALGDLSVTQRLNPATTKRLMVGSRTQTMRATSAPDDETIRRIIEGRE